MSRPEALPPRPRRRGGLGYLPGSPGLDAALPCLMRSSYTEMGFGFRNILIPDTLHSRSLALTRKDATG